MFIFTYIVVFIVFFLIYIYVYVYFFVSGRSVRCVFFFNSGFPLGTTLGVRGSQGSWLGGRAVGQLGVELDENGQSQKPIFWVSLWMVDGPKMPGTSFFLKFDFFAKIRRFFRQFFLWILIMVGRDFFINVIN